MTKKRLFALMGLLSLAAGVTYYLTQPYFAEKARIERLADQLSDRRGDLSKWIHRLSVDIPSSPQVADWRTEDNPLPQILFTIASTEDKTQVSYWALNIDGNNLQLLIPEGVLPPPVHNSGSLTDFSKYISRSPNGRYLIVPQKGGTILYDLASGDITSLGKLATVNHNVMWATDSSYAVIKKHYELTRVELPSKNVVQLTDVYGKDAELMPWKSSVFFDRKKQQILLRLDMSNGGGWFSCADMEFYQETFGQHLTQCGNTIVLDAKTFKVVDRGDFAPDIFDCHIRGSAFGDGFSCIGGDGGIYRSGLPSQKIGHFLTSGSLWGISGGEIWFTSHIHRNISRILPKPTESSPTIHMIYTFGGKRDGENVDFSAFGFGFSRYVIEHSEDEKWSDSLHPLPSYTDLKKAQQVLEARNHG